MTIRSHSIPHRERCFHSAVLVSGPHGHRRPWPKSGGACEGKRDGGCALAFHASWEGSTLLAESGVQISRKPLRPPYGKFRKILWGYADPRARALKATRPAYGPRSGVLLPATLPRRPRESPAGASS